MILGRIADQALITINGLEILGIVYLAIALSRLRARIAYLEGRLGIGQREEAEK